MTPDQIAALFTDPAGAFLCARWGRPTAPVLFGVADDSLAVMRAALTAAFRDMGQPMAETDPESGANLIGFFVRDWAELASVPDLDQLTGRPGIPHRLMEQDARRYRLLRFDEGGAIRACISFARVSDTDHPAALAESMAVNAALSFAAEVQPSPQIAALLRAAYDPRLPAVARDPAYALRLAARMA
ncbi:hypothetical protein DRW48_05015 [Paracoccus suum]|uniref:Uncharacterized protein n=1 Tax=Paracoccus suum TaxID=2259340 RepID=A0A344PIC0_9RHOB|nr:hypothetical protein [Paracoccus suum]AXC49125.1 hypothetical protein DRW48_05015 [Paracoccus suum]